MWQATVKYVIKWDFFFKVYNLYKSTTWLDSIISELLAVNKLPLGYTACCFPEAREQKPHETLFAMNESDNKWEEGVDVDEEGLISNWQHENFWIILQI